MKTDPQEHWISRGILISLASLFELCKAIGYEFEGNGDYNNGSIPGRDAKRVNTNYLADAEFFGDCIYQIKDIKPELKDAIKYFRDFQGKISVYNLRMSLIHIHSNQNLNLKRAIKAKGIEDAIKNFTKDLDPEMSK